MLIVVLLLSRTNVHRLTDALSHARPGEVATAFAVLLLGLVVNAFRWQVFLRQLGLALPAPALIRLTFVGTFFNAFLPTGFGGDARTRLSDRVRRPGLAVTLASCAVGGVVYAVAGGTVAASGSGPASAGSQARRAPMRRSAG